MRDARNWACMTGMSASLSLGRLSAAEVCEYATCELEIRA